MKKSFIVEGIIDAAVKIPFSTKLCNISINSECSHSSKYVLKNSEWSSCARKN